MIPSSLVRSMMSEDSGFMQAIVFELARSYRRLVKELKTQKLRNSVQRLANWIVKESLANNGTDVVTIPYEKRILAAYLGMTPENLSRSFANLGAHGVSVQASAVKIIDYDKLLAFASPSPLIDKEEPVRGLTKVSDRADRKLSRQHSIDCGQSNRQFRELFNHCKAPWPKRAGR